MRVLIGAMVACLLASGAAAQQVSPGDVLAVITDDWNGDGGQDRATLVANDDGADLYLYLSASGPDERTLAAHVPAIVWRGGAWGQQPELAISKSGALQVRSMNEAIGRNRWHETLTILYRDGRFVVGGYTYGAYDTLDPDAGFGCDINLFNGKGVFDGKARRTDARASPVEDWAGTRRADGLCPEQ